VKITGPESGAFMDDFQQALDKFSVPAQEQAELKAIVVEPGAGRNFVADSGVS
jgi:hypothetical protein